MSPDHDRQREPLGCDLRTSITWGLFFCRIVAGLNELIFRRPGTAGHAYWRPAFFGLALPLMAAEANRGMPFDPASLAAQVWCQRAALGLLVLWLLHLLAAQRNRGVQHSQFCGCTWFSRRPRPLVELVLGLLMAYGAAHLSPPLGNLIAFSSVATVLSVSAANVQRRVAADVAFDQMIEGQEFAADLRRHRW